MTREHPNGARELSAIWLVSGNAESDRRQLEKMGFGHAVPIKLPQVGATGFCVPVGPTALLALQPEGKGIAAETMASGGPRILGVSFGVADLGACATLGRTRLRAQAGDVSWLVRRVLPRPDTG